MTRKLLIAAGPRLFASLAAQFRALGGYELRDMAADPNGAEADAALLDGAFCDAQALALRLRRTGFSGPIIVIDADAAEADAHLPRPFRLADLLAALEAAPKSQAGEEFTAQLTEKEAAILDRLVRAGGEIVTKAAPLADVWGYSPNVSTRTLETHIHRLRQKIEIDPARPQRLLTAGGGYRIGTAIEEEISTRPSP
jgi:hypothetical protein